MLFRRLIVNALVAAARNPHVQRKAGEAAGKAMQKARPGLMKASRRAGELTRKASDTIHDKIAGPDAPQRKGARRRPQKGHQRDDKRNLPDDES